MKITLLGTGTPHPSLKRASSGYLIEIGDDKIVMDHGPDAHHRLIQTGVKATQVTHAFFSHLHYDHCMDYPRLVLQRWDMGADKIPDLKVYGPPPIKRTTRLLFDADGVFGPDINARIRHQLSIDVFESRGGKTPRRWPAPEVTEIRPGDVIAGKGWTLKVAEASHAQPELECYAFRLESKDGSMCYSGDSGGVCRDVIDLARGVDVLVHMVHFMSGTEPSAPYRAGCGNHIDTARIAKEAGVKTLVTSHMLASIDEPGVRECILKEMMEIFDGRIIWGEDLMVVPLSGSEQVRMG
jgi:ribonuclease BN (tRNA processing enzyme)